MTYVAVICKQIVNLTGFYFLHMKLEPREVLEHENAVSGLVKVVHHILFLFEVVAFYPFFLCFVMFLHPRLACRNPCCGILVFVLILC